MTGCHMTVSVCTQSCSLCEAPLTCVNSIMAVTMITQAHGSGWGRR